MLVRVPILLPQLPDTIQSVCLKNTPDIIPQLAVWAVSANNVSVATFLRQLQTLSFHHGERNPQSLTTLSFKKWASWCAEQDRNPLSGPISDVANFSPELYEQGYKYSSLNAYRLAISSTHEKVDGQPVGQHPTIVRVLKEAFNMRPPLPKYSITSPP